jgi:hypothetical protein
VEQCALISSPGTASTAALIKITIATAVVILKRLTIELICFQPLACLRGCLHQSVNYSALHITFYYTDLHFYNQGFFLAERAATAFRNLFEGTKFQKSKNKIINKSSISKFKEFSKLAQYLRPSR